MPKKLQNFLAALLILGGLGVFAWPFLSGALAELRSREAIRQVQQVQSAQPAATAPETAPALPTAPQIQTEATTAPTDAPSEMDLLYESICSYNQAIYEAGQENFRDPFSYEASPIDLTEYGFRENVIGALWIPRLEVELPVYLGATQENLANGAAVLGETSLPAVGDNTNVVIAAHRGYGSAPMFRDIQLIQLGDKITLTTPWETMVYRVCDLEIIDPDGTDAVLIQEGRSLLTLLTCHPYTQNYQRYLVRAEYSPEEAAADKETDLQEAARTYTDAPRQVRSISKTGESAYISVAPEGLADTAQPEQEGSDLSNRILWLEQVAPIAVLVMLALLIVIKVLNRRRKG